MKISQNTLNILKNFSTINSSIQFRSGDMLNTLSPFNDIVGEAKLDEALPRDFAIYDLPKFLSIQNMLNDPELTFNEEYVEIKSGNRMANFGYADPSVIKSLTKKIKMPSLLGNITISADDMEALFKAARLLQYSDLTISSTGTSVTFTAQDNKNDAMGNFVIETFQETEQPFEVTFKFDSLKIIPGAYEVSIAKEIGNFKHESGRLQYWVATGETGR